MWVDSAISEKFHLSLPKEGSLIHPEQTASNLPKDGEPHTCSVEVNEKASNNQDDQRSSRSLETSSNGDHPGYIEACIPSLQSAQGEHRRLAYYFDLNIKLHLYNVYSKTENMFLLHLTKKSCFWVLWCSGRDPLLS